MPDRAEEAAEGIVKLLRGHRGFWQSPTESSCDCGWRGALGSHWRHQVDLLVPVLCGLMGGQPTPASVTTDLCKKCTKNWTSHTVYHDAADVPPDAQEGVFDAPIHGMYCPVDAG